MNTELYPLTSDRPTYQTPRDNGQGVAQYLENDRTDILNIITAPASVHRRIPKAAKAESSQIITDILYIHSKEQGGEARHLERLLLALPKVLWLEPTKGESEKTREYVESLDETRKPRFVQNRFHRFYNGRWEELIDAITNPERTTAHDEPKQQRRKNERNTLTNSL